MYVTVDIIILLKSQTILIVCDLLMVSIGYNKTFKALRQGLFSYFISVG